MTFRLHSRLVVWNLLIIALISSILGYFLNHALRDHVARDMEAQLHRESRLAAAYLLNVNPGASPDETADEISKLLGRTVTLTDWNGRIVGDSDLEGENFRSAQ